MKKLLPIILLLPCIAMGANASPNANSRASFTITGTSRNVNLPAPVKGTVKDDTGSPLPGVSVSIKGTTRGTQTDADGRFNLDAKSGDVLVFSYIGYLKKEVPVSSSLIYAVTLTSDSKNLNEVVVTALGVKRSEKSLTYANQVVDGAALNTVKNDNVMNSLNGRVAGVDISPSSSGVGGSVKVILRGSKSFAGTNAPLYVIDGVPITNNSNTNGQPNSTYGGSPDGGDGISNLNPDDIESMTVLEGASAAALYGSQAANGVILITTKKGKAGKTEINFSSSYTNDAISYKPEFQNEYGVTPKGNQSWGAKLSTPATADNVGDYFQHGNNFTNAINLSAGSDVAQSYFSYANTSATGVQPTNSLKRNNFTFRETGHFLNNKLTVDVNTNYMNQKVINTPGQGFYFNTLPGLYLFPVGVDITPYKNNYGIPQPARNGLPTQNWIANEDIQQNPWWILYKNPNFSNRDRLLINSSVRYDINDWLNIQARGNVDRTSDAFEQDLYAGTNPVLTQGLNGSYQHSIQTITQTYGDFIANFKVPMKSDFKLDGLLGASITDNNTVGTLFGQGTGLLIPNVFEDQNVLTSGSSNVSKLPANHNQIQSIFGSLNLSYKNWAYLTLTDRNDWSSNLAFTNKDSYSYPSVGLSFIVSDMTKLPDFISYAKVRGSYAEVATTVTQYVTNLTSTNGSGGVTLVNPVPNSDIKPTNTKSWEAGADLRFLDNRLVLNYTWYKSNSYNQFIQYTPSAGSPYTTGYLNAGNIQNTGMEVKLGYDIAKGQAFSWNSALNYSYNKNLIIQLNPADPNANIQLTGNGANAYESVLKAGGSYGDIWGVKFERNAAGQIMVNSSDAPINSGIFEKVGNPSPKFQMGWENTFNYKKFSFDFLVDGKFGGQVLSMTQMLMDSYGVSVASGDARNAGGVTVNAVDPNGKAVTKVDAETWYSAQGGRSGIAEPYMYSATVVRLRSASLGYTEPIANSFVKSIRFSLIGSNLIYFYKKAPYDPEITMSTANGLGGVDVFNQPTTRRFGAQLNVTF
ncbi:TonB-linked outer membrane protein, SusC/RagA family [Mucilaginibacter mallensis]|uniref:TonB-linked outer membrane protein, SusC/RagA family n=1 Tax=Mucilaginibacter mallensis TaxID=652787 RepID=A0A1H2B175_MUCMA|nr:SusC/RagA family TonB-linked outer membrane protein [Mucilaginibacter mallensis]SDT51749.1 TonB-linked outer membrane protein, SusC/RagA family [Mucilaginibacter mallensis]